MVHHLGRIEADPVSGMSGREQILRRMRSADVLLLLHGTEPICSEYIPSKMYEYLWMQRPIVATVHDNAQMSTILRGLGHVVVESGGGGNIVGDLSSVVQTLMNQWSNNGLRDSGCISPYTTRTAVEQLVSWVKITQKVWL
jgi:hypothetical protein